MDRISSTLRIVAATLLITVVVACATSSRPPGPPEGVVFELPEGAVPRPGDPRYFGSALGRSLRAGFDSRFEGKLPRDESGRSVFRVLALSGGGSRGAFGAGLLVGWSEAGTRPQFEVVTGISTGALMAPFAFLGPDYDHVLEGYTETGNEHVFIERGPLSAVFSDALRDSAPLRASIAQQVDAEVLEAVAKEHNAGRRLFVGIVNLDAGALITWDMGEIAAGERPDKLQRFRDILLASASFPMVFPPVYITVDVDGESHAQMHVDGSVRANVFAANFMLDLDEAIERSSFEAANVREEIWLIHNGQAPSPINLPVEATTTAIGVAAIDSLLEVSSRGSIAELYALAMLNGFDFVFASIPPEFKLGPSAVEFDRAESADCSSLVVRVAGPGRLGSGILLRASPSSCCKYSILRYYAARADATR